MVVATFKWLGTVAPTILFYLVLAPGILIFGLDPIYIGMRYQKFHTGVRDGSPTA